VQRHGGLDRGIEEGEEVIDKDFEGALMDAALIGAAQRVEHYEIAAYGTVCAFAKELGQTEHESQLTETLARLYRPRAVEPHFIYPRILGIPHV
jgi:ferritin-like metal-binding protein YciE